MIKNGFSFYISSLISCVLIALNSWFFVDGLMDTSEDFTFVALRKQERKHSMDDKVENITTFTPTTFALTTTKNDDNNWDREKVNSITSNTSSLFEVHYRSPPFLAKAPASIRIEFRAFWENGKHSLTKQQFEHATDEWVERQLSNSLKVPDFSDYLN